MTDDGRGGGDGSAGPADEATRRLVAGGLGVAALVLAVFLAFLRARFPGPGASVLAAPMIAASVALALVLGFRALDGGIRFSGGGGRRRRRGSRSASAIVLWLACFAAIETAFLVGAGLERTDVKPRADGSGMGTRSTVGKRPAAADADGTTGRRSRPDGSARPATEGKGESEG